MKVGLEISSSQPIHIKAGNYIETFLIRTDKKSVESYGFDGFNYPLTVIPGHILAATGRRNEYRLNNLKRDYSIFDAEPTQQVEISEAVSLNLLMKTDLYHNNRSLPYSFIIDLLVDSQKETIKLKNFHSIIECSDDKTKFIIDLTSFIKSAPVQIVQHLKWQ